ncbi:MAG: CBS domain-containing protein [Actinobacteria bacterium]|nr:CBS domain-containing protein [Actinomycetota bacterium]
MRVREIMHREVRTIAASDTFSAASKVLGEHRISSLVVSGDRGAAGIVTERDFVRLVAEGLDPATTRLADRMTRELVTIHPGADVAEAARLMREEGVRHLPVMERQQLVGILSMRDVLSWGVEEMTGGHELPDFEGSAAALSAAVGLERPG